MGFEDNVGESPSYQDFLDKYGQDREMKEALSMSIDLEERYPDLTATGSVPASKEIYGWGNLRDTSQGLDFVAPEESLEMLSEEEDDTWSYMQTLVFDHESWAVAAIPMDRDVFKDEELGAYRVPEEIYQESREIDTSLGEINVLPPEEVMASKFRRYTQQKKNRSSFKESDLVDIGNMMWRQSNDDFISRETLAGKISRYSDYLDDWIPEMRSALRDSKGQLESLDMRQINEEANTLEDLMERVD